DVRCRREWYEQRCVFLCRAEDGIRDSSVTGVQTCALPIACGCAVDRRFRCGQLGWHELQPWYDRVVACGDAEPEYGWFERVAARSEERRVGKEGGERRQRRQREGRDEGRHGGVRSLSRTCA